MCETEQGILKKCEIKILWENVIFLKECDIFSLKNIFFYQKMIIADNILWIWNFSEKI